MKDEYPTIGCHVGGGRRSAMRPPKRVPSSAVLARRANRGMTTIDPDVSRALAGCAWTAEQAGEALVAGMRPALERLALPVDLAEQLGGVDLDLTGAHLEEE